jgi:import receptor subunit TOM22
MVKVKEVPEDSSPYASSDSEATGSSESLASNLSDIDIENESLVDRIVALVDIIPPQTRHEISTRVGSVVKTVQRTGKVVGNIVWVLTTSALLVGLPLALVLEDEHKFAQQEREHLAQQQGQQGVRLLLKKCQVLKLILLYQLLNPGLLPSKDQQKKEAGVVPPGF